MIIHNSYTNLNRNTQIRAKKVEELKRRIFERNNT